MKNHQITLKETPKIIFLVFLLFLSSFPVAAKSGYLMDIDSGLVDSNGNSVTLEKIENDKGGLYYQPYKGDGVRVAVYVDLGFYQGVRDNGHLEIELASIVSDHELIKKSLDGLVKAAYVYKSNGMYTLTNTAWVSDRKLSDIKALGFSLNYSKINNRTINTRVLIPAMRKQKEFSDWERYLKAFSYLHELAHASLESTLLNSAGVKVMTLLSAKNKATKNSYRDKFQNISEIKADLIALNLIYKRMLMDGLKVDDIKKISSTIMDIRSLDEDSTTHRTETAISNFTNLIVSNIEKYKRDGVFYGISLIKEIGY